MAVDDSNVLANVKDDYVSGVFARDKLKAGELLDEWLTSHPNIVLISLGCGNGYSEAHIKKKYPRRCIFGVDPAPNKYNSVPEESFRKKCVKPFTETLDTGKLDRFINNNNILLINWPNPRGVGYGTDSRYDLDAIIRMKPKSFFLNYGPCGAAGTNDLINTIDTRVKSTDVKVHPARHELTIKDITYYLQYSHTCIIGSGSGFMGKTFRCVVYTQEKHGNPVLTEKTIPGKPGEFGGPPGLEGMGEVLDALMSVYL